MTDQEPITLPTARQAMRYAVALAGDINATEVELDRARTWVVIAAELRAGASTMVELETEVGTEPLGANEFFERQGAIRRNDPNEDFGTTLDGSPAYGAVGEERATGDLLTVKALSGEERVYRRVDIADRPLSSDIPNREADLRADDQRWSETAPTIYRHAAGEQDTRRFEIVLPRCAHCGLAIEWLGPDGVPAQWVHKTSQQAVCATFDRPAEDADVTIVHTFATPAVPQGGDD